MERKFLDHEVILRTALCQHSRALAVAHKKLVKTATKLALSANDSTLVTNALAISNMYHHQASYASAQADAQIAVALDKYKKNKAAKISGEVSTPKRQRSNESDDSMSSATKKIC